MLIELGRGHRPVQGRRVDLTLPVLGLDGSRPEEITEDAKGLGVLHHRFLAGDGELIVVDEWGAADQFQNFFAGNTKVEKITAAAGVLGASVRCERRRTIILAGDHPVTRRNLPWGSLAWSVVALSDQEDVMRLWI